MAHPSVAKMAVRWAARLVVSSVVQMVASTAEQLAEWMAFLMVAALGWKKVA